MEQWFNKRQNFFLNYFNFYVLSNVKVGPSPIISVKQWKIIRQAKTNLDRNLANFQSRPIPDDSRCLILVQCSQSVLLRKSGRREFSELVPRRPPGEQLRDVMRVTSSKRPHDRKTKCRFEFGRFLEEFKNNKGARSLSSSIKKSRKSPTVSKFNNKQLPRY